MWMGTNWMWKTSLPRRRVDNGRSPGGVSRMSLYTLRHRKAQGWARASESDPSRGRRAKDVVLGPATDGGYYLIGLAGPREDIFEQMPWSTADVLARTISRLGEAGVEARLLEEKSDVDRAEDLPVWEEARKLEPEV